MDVGSIESAYPLYPLSFREEDTKLLGEHLRLRHSVDLVGMKRVGISNFLRFFLYRDQIKETYISQDEKHLFIPVDLNDLVEREIYPFWTLTFKRILDEVESADLPEAVKQKIASSFLSSIQTNDLFLLLDGIRRSLTFLVQYNLYPTLFFLRFDRIKDVVTPEFFDNLQGLRDATNGKLAYVFTSFRSLDELSPKAFSKADLSAFCQTMYIQPLLDSDIDVVIHQYIQRYSLTVQEDLKQEIMRQVGGNVQFLQLALIILNEQKENLPHATELAQFFIQDERMTLLSEELWESLTDHEKDALTHLSKGDTLSDDERRLADYIFQTGMVKQSAEGFQIFSPLFAHYIEHDINHVTQKNKDLVFSKKEHLLFTLLQAHQGEICERDVIIEAVWPEYKEFGVSDWSIDRLVARVRNKLKKQASPYAIRTIRTRGYMLTDRV